MAEFLAYVHALRREIDGFLETTRLRVEPSRALVACGYCPQHFVPVVSLATHARKCHGDRYYYEKRDSHAFFYQMNADTNTTASDATMPRLLGTHEAQDPPSGSDPAEDGDGSLVEPRAAPEAAPLSSDPSSIPDAIMTLAPHTSALYTMVQNWRRIPRTLAHLNLSGYIEANGPLRAKLERWIQHEIARLSSGDDVDADLVEYVLGLLDHPEFCHPDLIVVELEEFLGASDVRPFVLALWKFVIIEIGVQTLPAAPPTSIDQSQAGARNTAAPAGPKPPPPVTLDAKRPPAVTRRRPTYRAKATRAGPYDVVREILAKSMAQLSEETGRELAMEPTTPVAPVVETREHSSHLRTPVESWTEYTDALSVRDMARPRRSHVRSRSPSRGSHRPSRRRRHSRSRSRSRSTSRDRPSRQRSDRDRDSGFSRSGHRRSRDRRQPERRTY